MKIEIQVSENSIISAVRHLIMIGRKPTLKNTKALIREMLTQYGEMWDIEPTIDDFPEQIIVEFDEAEKIAQKIAPEFYSKIY